MPLKILGMLILVRRFNVKYLIFLNLFIFSTWSSFEKEDRAIVRYGRSVIFEKQLIKTWNNLRKISCLSEKSYLFSFIDIKNTKFKKPLEVVRKNPHINELILLIKAKSLSTEFYTLKSSKRLESELKKCRLPQYSKWSVELKELISFEIYLRERFEAISNSSSIINQKIKNRILSFKSSISQREPYDWLIP